MTEEFDFEIDRIASTIIGRKANRVILQFPEGLKRQAAGVALSLSRNTEAQIIVHGEPCFGACDVPKSRTDLIVQFGHLPIPSLDTPNSMMFIQARSSADPIPVLERAYGLLPSKVGLLTTAQHIHMIVPMVEFLKSKGKDVLVGKGDGRLFAEGQVLGCNASCARSIAKKVDAFVYVGTGDFHPLAISLAVPNQVLAADPISNEIKDMAETRDRLLRQRHGAIERARDARRFGILLSEKPGQRREKLAEYSHRILAQEGREAVIVEMDLVTPVKLTSLGLDAWVSTACPRVALDDSGAFDVPVLTPVELEILLKKRQWEDYSMDEILESQ